MPRGFTDYDTAIIQQRLWTPRVLSWLSWHDFSDLSTVDVDSSGINSLREKTSNGKTFSQSNNSYKPASQEQPTGNYAGNFGTSGKILASSSSWAAGAKSIFLAYKADSVTAPNAGRSIASFKDTSANSFTEVTFPNYAGYQPRSIIADYTANATARGISDAMTTNPEVMVYTYDGVSNTSNSSYSAKLNGTIKSVIASGATGRLDYATELSSLSGRANSSSAPIQSTEWDGKIYETLVASGVMSARDIQLVEGYHSWKWSIPLAADQIGRAHV